MENTKIANASVIAMGMVVGIHTAGREIATLEFGSVIWWWCALGMYGVFQIAVPFFFFCSGYFLAKHIDEDGWYSGV
jgi:surface polysaccharide O-acyltransferase-like enzyme